MEQQVFVSRPSLGTSTEIPEGFGVDKSGVGVAVHNGVANTSFNPATVDSEQSLESTNSEWVDIYGRRASLGSTSLRSNSKAHVPVDSRSVMAGCGRYPSEECEESLLDHTRLSTTATSDDMDLYSSRQFPALTRGRYMSLPVESCTQSAAQAVRNSELATSFNDRSTYCSRCLSCPEEGVAKFEEDQAPSPSFHGDKKLLRPLKEIRGSGASPMAWKKGRDALIAELERRKGFLQAQLEWLQREVSAWNIFALVRACNTAELQYLLERKMVDVNRRDYNGCTPLHVAALGGNESVVRVLISFGADITAFDSSGRTPLDWAAENRHSSVCRLLTALTKDRHGRMEPRQDSFSGEVESNPTSGEYLSSRNGDVEVVSKCAVGAAKENSFPPVSGIMKGGYSSLQSHGNCDLMSEKERQPPYEDSPGNSFYYSSLPPDMVAQYRAEEAARRAEEKSEEECDEKERERKQEVYNGSLEDVSQYCSSYTTVSDTVSLIVCMVGLPGRGKSFIGRRIARYLNWKGVPCRVFNVGDYRRKLLGVEDTYTPDFFNPHNAQAKQMREKMAAMASVDLIRFVARHRLACGVFDATNTTKARRKYLLEYFSTEARNHNINCKVIFIESICNDPKLITENILRAKCGNDDFRHVTDTSEVIASFNSRITEYEKVYEQVDVDEGISFIRIVNVKHHIVLHKLPCGLASLISFFLLNLHPVAHPIFIALPGETVGDKKHIYGGDGRLTPLGERFAESLKDFILERDVPHMVVLHGTNPSVMRTLRPLGATLEGESSDDNGSGSRKGILGGGLTASSREILCPLPGLDSINCGRFCGLTVKQVRDRYANLYKLLYAVSPMGSGNYLSPEGTGGKPTDGPNVSGSGNEGEEKTCQSELRTASPKQPDLEEIEKSNGGIDRFLHVPNGADPRLSYCVQFPNGESCRQVNVRLEQALMAVMRVKAPVFVVASAAPAQGILAFFADELPEMAPALRLPSHAVVEIGVKGEITVHQLVEPCGQQGGGARRAHDA
uniref:Putative 6-phosphofructo-2-kinase/fructose-2,6-biphosphatase n=1 Tax=Trypanosoma congolense (strain IL3000) TaxID=1068625 RepID=G0UK34_TRYCI|nr:putative 6-phosphofructo-2-kinase/fructose-2,6-biphosphatase [Trypanosoma congolense IL3000]